MSRSLQLQIVPGLQKGRRKIPGNME